MTSQPICLVAGDGKPQTINLCKNCYNLRLAERKESEVTNVKEKARWLRQKDVATICSPRVVGKGFVGRGDESGAAGDKLARRVTTQGVA